MTYLFLGNQTEVKSARIEQIKSKYLKNNEANKELIEQFGYVKGKKNIFHPHQSVEFSNLGTLLTNLFWPFYKETNLSENEIAYLQREYFRMIH